MPNKQTNRRHFAAITLAALALILYLRLIPFVFAWDGRIPIERVQWHPLSLLDIPFNILIFTPFGFGLAGLLARRSPAPGRRVVLAGVVLSALLEATQLFMPNRVPSTTDIAANGLGALLGYGLYRAWEMGVGRALNRYVTRRNLGLGLALYAVGVALLTGYLFRGSLLSNWDTSYPLVVGNEATGDRPWQGWVGSLALEAGNNSNPAFLADYALEGAAPFEATARTPLVPPLIWREGPATPQDGRGVVTGADEWLMTSGPFREFSETARRTNALAVQAEVATADLEQLRSRRIVSVSAGVYHRNVSVIQQADALVVRLRTLSNGENGHRPEVALPGVFTDQQPRRITVAYSAPMLRVTVDGQRSALSLGPGVVFFADIRQENLWTVPMAGNPYRYDIYYGLIMAGLAAVTVGGLLLAKRIAGRRG